MSPPTAAAPSTERQTHITHDHLVAFADKSVNLKREDAAEYRKQVNTLRDNLASYAAEHPVHGIEKMMLSGSLAKGLALKTLNDIDVAVYVKGEKARAKEADLLNWLADRLREAYHQMKPDQITVNDHSVTVAYSVSGLNVDVVPIKYFGDKDWRGELFSTKGGKPITTSVPQHLEFTRARKDKQKDHYAQMIRFMKWWAKLRKDESDSFRLKSFMSEMIAAKLLDTATIEWGNYPKAFEQIFTHIVTTGLKPRVSFSDFYPASKLPGPTGAVMELFDPVYEGNNVASQYTEQNRKLIIDAASDALDAICQAHYATTRGQAIECWQVVLGRSFRGDL